MSGIEITPGMTNPWAGSSTSGVVVGRFLCEVRLSGDPGAAERVMAPSVSCHQVVAEADVTITRSPAEYAGHVRDMRTAFGAFSFTVTEFITGGDKVFVRWKQDGHDLVRDDGSPGTGRPVREVGSAVYRVAGGRIVEYWVQLDRWGMQLQLKR